MRLCGVGTDFGMGVGAVGDVVACMGGWVGVGAVVEAPARLAAVLRGVDTHRKSD